MKIYAYSSLLTSVGRFTTKACETIFRGMDPDVIATPCGTRLYSLNYDGKRRLLSYSKLLRNDKPACYNTIKQNIAMHDIVVIMPWSKSSTNADNAISIYEDLLQFKTTFNAAMSLANYTWLVAAHIVACIELDKPFVLYSFDPYIDYNYGINRMHSFVDYDKTRLMPAMEASISPASAVKSGKCLCYSAKLYAFNRFSNTGRRALHDAIAAQTWQNSSFNIETSNGWWAIGDALPFDEPAYLNAVSKHKFAICPPNYSNECYSIKRAIDTICYGSIPVFVDTSLVNGVSEVWQPLQSAGLFNVKPDKLSEIEQLNMSDAEYAKLYNCIVDIAKSIDIRAWLEDYINNWQSFKHDYIPFIN